MWKKGKEKRSSITEHEDYVKAAARAWYLHGNGAPSKPVKESNKQTIQQFPIERRPTRFKLEAMGLLLNNNWMENSLAILDTVGSDSFSGCTSFRDLSSEECETEICGNSLFDYYELVALLKQLELLCWGIANPAYGKEPPMSTKSWMHHGTCPDLCNKKPNTRFSRNSSQVVISGYIKGKESSGSEKKYHHWKFYNLARKFQAWHGVAEISCMWRTG